MLHMSKTPSTKTPTPTTDAHDHTHDHDHAGHTHAQPSLPIAPNSEVTVTLKWADVEPTYQKAVRRFGRNAKIDGFRKGKVPAAMVEGMIDQSALVEHVLQTVLPTAYSEVIKAEDKHPITQPEIEPVKVDKNSDWVLTARFAEAPEITLGKYQDLVKKAKKAADKDIKDAEADLKKKAAEKPEKKEAAPESKAEAQKPTDAEKPAETTPVTTLTDAQKEELHTRQIFRHLVEEIKPQIPELLVRREADRELRRLLDQLDQLKLSVENYLKSRQMSAEQLRLEYLSAAATSLQLEFILAEIGKTEQIKVEDQEIDDMMKQVFGDKLTEEQSSNADYRSYMFNTLAKQKIVKHLLSL